MRPFLLLSCRAEDVAADGEYEAFLRFTGLPRDRLRAIRMEAAPLPPLELDDYAGVFVGAARSTPAIRRRASPPSSTGSSGRWGALLDEIVERDFPFFGACYGIGTLGVHQGGIVDRTYAEAIGAVRVCLTDEGRTDPVLAGLTPEFDAFVGHKEACRELPSSAMLLASSPACPVQMFRVKTNVYATQFHPELDLPGLITRIHVYQHFGYFPPSELEELIARVSPAVVTEPGRMLANFVERYG